MLCPPRRFPLLHRDHRRRVRRPRFAAAVGLACAALICRAPLPTAASTAPEAVPAAGTCIFGTGGGDVLTASFSPAAGAVSGGLTAIAGTGSCISNAISSSVNLNLVLSGLWTCEGGEASGSGYASWSNGSPPGKLVVVTAAGGPGEIMLSLRDPTLRFEASATLAWSPTTAATCAASGGVSSTQLSGSMTYVAT